MCVFLQTSFVNECVCVRLCVSVLVQLLLELQSEVSYRFVLDEITNQVGHTHLQTYNAGHLLLYAGHQSINILKHLVTLSSESSSRRTAAAMSPLGGDSVRRTLISLDDIKVVCTGGDSRQRCTQVSLVTGIDSNQNV